MEYFRIYSLLVEHLMHLVLQQWPLEILPSSSFLPELPCHIFRVVSPITPNQLLLLPGTPLLNSLFTNVGTSKIIMKKNLSILFLAPPMYPTQTGPPQTAAYPSMMFPAQTIYMPQQYPMPMPVSTAFELLT